MSRPSRGLTLIELLVASAVSVLVIAAAVALLNAQERVFRGGNDERQVQETARIALDELSANLRMAGFGIDPALAFDFGPLPSYPQPQAQAGSAPSSPGYSTTAYPCAAPVACRDGITGSDEIVMRMRNPLFGHYLTRIPTTSTLTLNGPIGAGVLRAGQVLQVVCQTGTYTWAYVTVSQDVPPVAAGAEVTVQLKAGNGAVFPLQNGFLTDSCYQTVSAMPATAAALETVAKVLKVDLYHYFVQVIGGRPYLMLEQGLDSVPASVVAADVEDLQFAYLFPFAPAGLQLVGATSGTQLSQSAAGIDLAPATGFSTFTTVSTDPSIANHCPANIRAVEVSAVVRAPTISDTTTAERTTIPAAGNRPALVNQPAYRRFLIQSTAATRNLDARAPYFPTWAPGSPNLNLGGG